MAYQYSWRCVYRRSPSYYPDLRVSQKRDLAAISPTGTGKTLSYLLPIMAALGSPATSNEAAGKGVRAVIVAPTRELAHQIHNECLKLAEGRKWRIILFSKATASTLSDKAVRDKVGKSSRISVIRTQLMHGSYQISSSAPRCG